MNQIKINKREAYRVLDERLNNLMEHFWALYPKLGVSMTGSVLYGEWRVMRNRKFDGLTFKMSDEQLTDLTTKKECMVKESDLINQEEYIEPD